MDRELWWHVATIAALLIAAAEAVVVLGLARLMARFPGVGQPPPSPGVPIGTQMQPLLLPRLGTGVPELLMSEGVDCIVLFVTPSCSGCKELVPSLQPIIEQGSRRWEVLVIVCGARERAEAYANILIDRRIRVLLDPDGTAEAAFETLHFFPFGFEVSGESVVRARGGVNTWGQVHKLAADGALDGTPAGRPIAGSAARAAPSAVIGG